MKRFFGLLLICVLITLVLCPAASVAFAESNDVELSLEVKEQGEDVIATVTLNKNDGIADLYLRVEYDTSVLELKGRTFGSALSTLKPTDNFDEDEYEPPYRVEYLDNKNETDTGLLFTLRFKINEKAKNGSYPVKLVVRQVGTYSGDATVGIVYNAKYGEQLVVGADATSTTQGGVIVAEKSVGISGGEVSAIRDADGEKGGLSPLVIALIVIGAVVLVGAVAAAYVFYRKKNANVNKK